VAAAAPARGRRAGAPWSTQRDERTRDLALRRAHAHQAQAGGDTAVDSRLVPDRCYFATVLGLSLESGDASAVWLDPERVETRVVS